ncbi:MAG TPA: hypothetical protein VNT75_32100 [Symbiobacteriaceae bacterium]|nr:hypothetical protein [Symbiobacteriaceae bacterium]
MNLPTYVRLVLYYILVKLHAIALSWLTFESWWTEINWSAVAAIGQIVAAFATLLSLWFLGTQIKVMRTQTDQTNRQLELAVKQFEMSTSQTEEQRQEAVRPDLVLESPHCCYVNENLAQLSYKVRNLGVGPGYRVVLLWSIGDDTSGDVSSFPAIAAEGEYRIQTTVARPAEGVLTLEWHNRYGKKYRASWQVKDYGSAIETIDPVTGIPLPPELP